MLKWKYFVIFVFPQTNRNKKPHMYKVLDKDTIISEILPHLSIVKRGFK